MSKTHKYTEQILFIFSSVKFESIQTNLIQIPSAISYFFSKYNDLFKNNKNLWIKGGGARSCLIKYVFDLQNKHEFGSFTKQMPDIADIDLVLISPKNNQLYNVYKTVEKDVRESDVEASGSLDQYFASRDSTINEVLLRPDVMLFSRKAAADITKEIVKPTAYEYNLDYQDISPRACLRNILFSIKEHLKIHPLAFKSLGNASNFDILIHLFKAYESNIEEEFYDKIKNYINMSTISDPFIALHYLINNSDFKMTDKQLNIYNSELNEYYKDYFDAKYSE